MTPPIAVVWLSKLAWARMTDEASRTFPLESGGLLMGYAAPGARAVVVTDIIGPGINAIRTAASFIPDYPFHELEVHRRHQESSGQVRYLGDWHSHPDGPSVLSLKDRRTLHLIGTSREARVSVPLMVLACGRPSGWSANAFAGDLVKTLFGRSRCIAHSTRIQLFDPS